jgi:hypothetical protein
LVSGEIPLARARIGFSSFGDRIFRQLNAEFELVH